MTEPIEVSQPTRKRGSTRAPGKSGMVRCLMGAGVLFVAGVFGAAAQAVPAPHTVAGGEHLTSVTESTVTFECPQTSTGGTSGRLSASADIANSLKNAEPADVEERIGEIVARMRAQATAPDIIVNTLVAAYCPLVASESDLTAAEKTARVDRFARQVRDIAFSDAQQRVREVLVNVPLSPEVLRKVDRAARGAEVSRDTWLTRAIEKALPAAQ